MPKPLPPRISPASCIFMLMLLSFEGNCLTFHAAKKFRDLRSPEVQRLETFTQLERVQDADNQIVITIRFKKDTLRSYCIPKQAFGPREIALQDYPECTKINGETIAPLPPFPPEDLVCPGPRPDEKIRHNLEVHIWTASDRFACSALRDHCEMHRSYSAEGSYRYNLKPESNQLSELRIEILETRLVDVPKLQYWAKSAGWLALIPPAAIADFLSMPVQALLQLYVSLRYSPAED